MKIQGTFKNIKNQNIKIIISDYKNDNKIINIDNSNDIYFAKEPITISYEIDDSFETNITRLCTVKLLSKDYLGDYLYANNEHNIVINVLVNNTCIFAGYVEPNIYSQKYSEEYNELEITCTDFIATLQHNDILHDIDYDERIKSTKIKTFTQLLNDMKFFGNKLDLVHNYYSNVYYDKSKEVSSNKLIFNEIAINELLFIGEDDTDVYNNYDILHELLKYLDLHICQVGYDFYIFSWETVRYKGNTVFYNLQNNNTKTINLNGGNIGTNDYAANDTNISLDEVYNQLELKCDIKKADNVIDSPLSKDSLKPIYNNKQIYMQEIKLHTPAAMIKPFNEICSQNISSHDWIIEHENILKKDEDSIIDWYVRLMYNKNWTFKHRINETTYEDIYKDLNLIPTNSVTGQLYNQHLIMEYMKNNSLTAALIAFGHTENLVKSTIDRVNEKQPNMKTSLVISVNGNDLDESKVVPGEKEQFPDENFLQTHGSIIEYNNNKYINLSPLDDSVVNYIVFSGEIFLQPVQYSSIRHNPIEEIGGPEWILAQMKADDSDKTIYYDQKFLSKEYPNSTEVNITDTVFDKYLSPDCDPLWKKFQYNYSGTGEYTDELSKVPVLECELKIGDKYLCEYYTDTNNDGKKEQIIGWYDINHLPNVKYTENNIEETFTVHTFSLGFDPIKEDYIIGQKYDLANTVTIDMNIGDATGTAIPIYASDNLSGELSFKILGPINTIFNNVTRRHPTWFRKTKWTEEAKAILPRVENIFLTDFECKIYSDNGNYGNNGDKDLIYLSDETNNYVNKKDDITFSISTALSPDEAYNLEVDNEISLSNPYIKDDNGNFKLLRWINDNKKSIINNTTVYKGKPEELYIDSYYKEYSKPRKIYEFTLNDYNNLIRFLPYKAYKLQYDNDNYNLLSAECNLMEGTTKVVMKSYEI